VHLSQSGSLVAFHLSCPILHPIGLKQMWQLATLQKVNFLGHLRYVFLLHFGSALERLMSSMLGGFLRDLLSD
jgi:hypothetical protein